MCPEFSGQDVVERDGFLLFWKPPAVFSQWTPSPFVVDGIPYVNAEQFMMAEKARLFGDAERREQILGTADPKLQKALGQQVKRFSEPMWVAQRKEIVVRGNLAKFSQSAPMRAALLATGTLLLVEASPLDRIWGIGLRADDPRATRAGEWRGLNLLGEALMAVRDRIGSSTGASA